MHGDADVPPRPNCRQRFPIIRGIFSPTTRLDLATWKPRLNSYLQVVLPPPQLGCMSRGERAYLAFGVRLKLTPSPASNHTLIPFVAELAQSLASSSIQAYLAAVRHLHIINNLTNPLQNTPKIALVLSGTIDSRVEGLSFYSTIYGGTKRYCNILDILLIYANSHH